MGHSGSGEFRVKQELLRLTSLAAGKTTLLRALGGRESFTGDVCFGGKGVTKRSSQFLNKISFVSDQVALEPFSTCFEAIHFSARLRLPASFSDDEIDYITTETLKELKLEKCANVQFK